MTNLPSTAITADELSQELRALNSRTITLLMPVGALTRRLAITSIVLHGSSVELNTAHGEVLTFSSTDRAEIRRSIDVNGNQKFTRYELTFPLGEYFALIVADK